jgi:hypothetical protein
MATAAYSGTVTVSPSTLVHDIMSFELPYKVDTAETTSFSSDTPGTKTYVPTLQSAQVKLSGNRNTTDAGQNALRDAWINRTLLTMIFSPDGTSETHTMSCWVTDMSVKADPKGVVTFDVSLLMNGGATIA